MNCKLAIRSLARGLGLAVCWQALCHPAYGNEGFERRTDVELIRVNSIGFPLVGEKMATILGKCSEFRVQNATSKDTVFRDEVRTHPTLPNVNTADFSDLSTPGRYRIVVEGMGTSAEFEINDSVFNRPFYRCFHAMYLSRCGATVYSKQDGHEFKHDACHLADGLLAHTGTSSDGTKDGVGGWHDAGDYNKYVVNGAFTAGMLLTAWEHFAGALEPLDLRIPESDNKTPDFLDEIRWELEWLLKMQRPDGRIFHKLSALRFGGAKLPENDEAKRYFSPWSTAATADFVAVLAHASRVYRKYDAEFSKRCLDAAKLSYEILKLHEGEVTADLTKFSTGAYSTTDRDDRLWATSQLWESTGKTEFLNELEERIRQRYDLLEASEPAIQADWDWKQVSNLGMFTYVLSQRHGRDTRLVNRLTADVLSSADTIVNRSANHPYGRPLGDRYYWGCNGTVARLAMNLEVADRLSARSSYRHTQLHALSHLLGWNDYGRSYVTGVGHRPPQLPHDRRSMADKLVPPWPGYLIGGPWPKSTDWQDSEHDYKTNEIAINWNGAIVYALAAFVKADTFAADVKPIYSSPN